MPQAKIGYREETVHAGSQSCTVSRVRHALVLFSLHCFLTTRLLPSSLDTHSSTMCLTISCIQSAMVLPSHSTRPSKDGKRDNRNVVLIYLDAWFKKSGISLDSTLSYLVDLVPELERLDTRKLVST